MILFHGSVQEVQQPDVLHSLRILILEKDFM